MILHLIKLSQKIHRHYGKIQTIIAERDSSVSTNSIVKTPFKILRKKKKASSSQTECRELHLLVEQTGLSSQNTKVILYLSELSQIQLQDSEPVGYSARCKQQNMYVQDMTFCPGNSQKTILTRFSTSLCRGRFKVTVGKQVACPTHRKMSRQIRFEEDL